MRRFRFTIASFGGVVLFAAVGFAALRSSSAGWDSAVFGGALVILTGSLVLAVQRRGRSRAYWVGFAIVGWIYLGASLVPAIEARLPTTEPLTAIDAMRPAAPGGLGQFVADLDLDGKADLVMTNSSVPNNPGSPIVWDVSNSNPTARTWISMKRIPMGGGWHFVEIGHSLVALILAFVGGHASRLLHDRERSRAEPSTVAAPTASG